MSYPNFKPKPKSPYQKPKPKDGLEWYEKEDLISGCGLSRSAKHLLLVVKRSINNKKGTCWLTQKQLAEKMSVSVPTVERAFAVAVKAEVISSQRVRKGKGKYKQTNEYFIVWAKLQEMLIAKSSHQNDVCSRYEDGMLSMQMQKKQGDKYREMSEKRSSSAHQRHANAATVHPAVSTRQICMSTRQECIEHTTETTLSTRHSVVSGLEVAGKVVQVIYSGHQRNDESVALAPSTATDKAKSTPPATPTASTVSAAPPISEDHLAEIWFQSLPETEKGRYRDGKWLNTDRMMQGYRDTLSVLS